MLIEKLKKLFEKLPESIRTRIDDIIAPLVKIIVTQVTYMLMKELNDKSPSDAELVAYELYPITDVKLEEMVGKTDTPIDDAVVDGVLEGLEQIADEEGWELPNLDDD
ncbi:MAG: hypothetical protein ACFE95_02770 [Candidatus Hodarchaeota archaeon]